MQPPAQLQHGLHPPRRLALIALLLLVPAPSLGVAAAMVLEATSGTTLGKAAYVAAKLWILAMPLWWLMFVERRPWSLSPVRRGGLGTGAALGVLIAFVIIAAYLLLGDRLVEPGSMRRMAAANGLDDPVAYAGLALYLTLINSLLEEYVWRWFVFRQCERVMGSVAAVIAAAALFTIHHVIALAAQQSWTVALLGGTGVFIGSCVWSWCYARFRSIWPGYLSHVIADAAVFFVGWHILFN